MPGGLNAWKGRFATSTSTPVPATPTQTSLVTPSPVASPPAVTPAATATPASVPALTPTTEPPEKEKKGVPGFEAPLAIAMLIVLFVLLRRN